MIQMSAGASRKNGNLPWVKVGGLALMVAVIGSLTGSFLYPGGPIVDPVDQTNFPFAIERLGEYSTLAHITTTVVILAMMLQSFGLFTLYNLHGPVGGFPGLALRLGIIASLFGWGIFLVSLGMRHMVIHLMQRSMSPAEDLELQSQMAGLALTTHVEMAALLLAFIAVYPVASVLVGLGLSARFSRTNVYKIACYGLVAIGAGGFINFQVALHVVGISLDTLLITNNLLLSIGAVCLFVIGLGMFRGREEFAQHQSDD